MFIFQVFLVVAGVLHPQSHEAEVFVLGLEVEDTANGLLLSDILHINREAGNHRICHQADAASVGRREDEFSIDALLFAAIYDEMLFSLPLASSEHLDYLDLIDAFHHLQSLDLELYHATFFLIRRKTRVKLEFIAYLEPIFVHFGSQSRCWILEGIHVLLHSFLLDSYLFTRNVELTGIFGLLIGCLIALEDSFEVVMLFEDMQVVGE